MKNVILYTRVSTDDQADRGFSLPFQKDVLERYCNLHGYNIIKHYEEDHSAKTFERPEWIKLLENCRTNKQNIDLILFTRWDRFSRNTGDAYMMLRKLKDYGVFVNAIEQPLDLNNSDQKIMLAVYLAAPEVENDKISARTINGIQKALRQGYFVKAAPIGYENYRLEDGRGSIKPSNKAKYIKMAFELFMDTDMSQESIRKKIGNLGLKIPKETFRRILRNQIYAGLIFCREYRTPTELFAEEYVQGRHEPIISLQLFNDVQDKLDRKKRPQTIWSTKNENLPLRSHLLCPECGKKLTGSGSTGRHKIKYYYYHCRGGCNVRYKANEVHQIIDDFISLLTPEDGVADLYYDILKEKYGDDVSTRNKLIARKEREIVELNETILRAEDSHFKGEITADVFNRGKLRYVNKISELKDDIINLKTTGNKFMKRIKSSLEVFKNFKNFYESGSWETKQQIIGSIFSEKIVISKNKVRTAKLNGVFEDMMLKTNHLYENKKGQIFKILDLPHLGWKMGLEPTTLGTTNRCSNQLSYIHHFERANILFFLYKIIPPLFFIFKLKKYSCTAFS